MFSRFLKAISQNAIVKKESPQPDPTMTEYNHARLKAEAEIAAVEEEFGTESVEISNALQHWADTLLKMGPDFWDEAEAPYLRALAIRSRELEPDSRDLAATLSNLGSLYANQGRNEEAVSLYASALAICYRVLGAVHANTLVTLDSLVFAYQELEHFDEAGQLLEKHLHLVEQQLGPGHEAVASALYSLGWFCEKRNEPEKAAGFYRRAISIWAGCNPQDPDNRLAMRNLAHIEFGDERYPEAADLYGRILEMEREHQTMYREVLDKIEHNLSTCYGKLDRHEDNLWLSRQILADRIEAFGEEHPLVWLQKFGIGQILVSAGRREDAKLILQKLQRDLAPDNPLVPPIQKLLADCE